jgi:phenylacetic acid degradation operon negative regulatory protein
MAKARWIDFGEVLELFCWGIDKLTNPTLRNLLAGYEEYLYRERPERLFGRMEQEGLIQRTGYGKQSSFTITASGKRLVAGIHPRRNWEKKWDGVWRVVAFDVPEARRKDRYVLWQALRARKLGLLQGSVWVWPHEVESILREIVQVEGAPECFCGFEARRLFLCTDRELVGAAWDFEEIGRRQQIYLQHLVATPASLGAARKLAMLAKIARIERRAYRDAFSLDPLLPRTLWPKEYHGPQVQERHEQFRATLQRRLEELTANEMA